MSSPFPDRLRERLVTAGISPRYARRLISELGEHSRDLIEALTSAGHSLNEARRLAHQRLGSEDDIVNSVLATRRFRSFAHRAPLLVFVLVPVLAVPVLAVAATVLAGMSVFMLWTEFGLLNRQQATYLFLCAFIGMVPAVFGITAACAVGYARSRRCSLVWPLITAVLLACIAAVLRFDYGPAHASIAVAIATSGPYRVMLPLIPFLILVSIWFAGHRSRSLSEHPATL